MKKIIPISKLRVGQKFRFIPDAWFGPSKLISKQCRFKYDDMLGKDGKSTTHRHYVYDIHFDAKVVNPPSVQYGVHGNTKVKLISEKDWQSRWEK